MQWEKKEHEKDVSQMTASITSRKIDFYFVGLYL